MKSDNDDEDFVENSQPVLRSKTVAFKKRILIPTDPVSIPKKLAKNPLKTPSKLDDKSQVKIKLTQEFTPGKRNRNFSLSPFTPSKINSDLYDTSHLGDIEAIDMLHDPDDILDLDDQKFLPDSMLNASTPDVISNVRDSVIKPAEDSLSIDNDCKSNIQIDQSPVDKSVTTSSTRKSNRTKRASFVTKTPRIQFKHEKFRSRYRYFNTTKEENLSLPEGEIEEEISSILKEIYNAQEQELLSPQTIRKLRGLEVRLTHKAPPQHQIESRAGTRAPSQAEKKEFELLEPMTKGKFTEEEDCIIRNNWKSFCKIHKWDEKNPQPFLCLRRKGKSYIPSIVQRQKFFQFLANGLPSRTLYSVYFRFRNLFDKKFHTAKGRFNEDEDRKIMLYMKCATDSNQQFSKLAKILGRTNHSIWARYQKLKRTSLNSKPKEKQELLMKVVWTAPLIEEFLNNFMEVTLSEDVIELKNAVIPKVVWEEMESRLSIAQNVLKNYWSQKLHLQLFSSMPILLNDVKIKLIEYLYEKRISHPREINWSNLCSLFDGMTTAFICEIVYRLVRHVRRKKIYTSFADIVDYLYEVMIPILKKQSQDKYLPRISYKDGTIEVLEEDAEEILIRSFKEEYDDDAVPRRSSSTFNEQKDKLKDKLPVVWTLRKREKFLRTLLDLMVCKDIQELEDAIIPKVVWEEMEEKMKVDKNTLSNLWYKELHLQLFSPNPIYMNDLKIKLIELIYNEQITDLEGIIWPKVCSYLNGMTTVFISQVFNDIVNSASEEINSKDFCDIMEYLHETMISKLKSQPDDRYLPRITFKNKTMKVVDENFEEEIVKKERKSSTSDKEEELKDEQEIHWTLQMRGKFIKKLLAFNHSRDIQELKDAIIPKVVWNELGENMNVDQKILRELWYFELHMQLFCQNPIFMNDIKIKLIEFFYDKQITDLRQVSWPNVCKYFDGLTTFFLIKVFYNLVRSASKEINSDDLCDIIEYLYEEKLPTLKDKVTDEVLPRLSYERGSIKVIEEDDKDI